MTIKGLSKMTNI